MYLTHTIDLRMCKRPPTSTHMCPPRLQHLTRASWRRQELISTSRHDESHPPDQMCGFSDVDSKRFTIDLTQHAPFTLLRVPLFVFHWVGSSCDRIKVATNYENETHFCAALLCKTNQAVFTCKARGYLPVGQLSRSEISTIGFRSQSRPRLQCP